MTPVQKISAALAEHGIRDFDLVWATSTKGKLHDFRLTVREATLRGCTTRAIIRALTRHLAPKSGAKNRGKISYPGASSELTPYFAKEPACESKR